MTQQILSICVNPIVQVHLIRLALFGLFLRHYPLLQFIFSSLLNFCLISQVLLLTNDGQFLVVGVHDLKVLIQ